MRTIDFTTLQNRVPLLEEINPDLSKEDINRKFQEEVTKLCKQDEELLIVSAKHSPHPEKGSVLFRTTTEYDDFNQNQISCFSYPPETKTPLNRCNIPKNPVFYCSDTSSISISEVLQNKKHDFPVHLYLSEWGVENDVTWKILPFIFKGLPSTNKAFEYAVKNKQEVLDKYKNILAIEDIDRYVEYYHDVFRNEKSFKFSSIISYKFLYEDNGDIIFYPTVQVEAEGNNYAVNKKWIDNKTILLKKVHKFRIEKINNIYNWYLEELGNPINETTLDWKVATSLDLM